MPIDDLWNEPNDDATDVAAGNDTPATTDATDRDMSEDAATLPRQEADSDATLSRQTYTLTVEDVAVTLADHNVYRDPRTIQRWCKSGRLDCILDQENGERYLITETSLQKIVATLTTDRERLSRRLTAPQYAVLSSLEAEAGLSNAMLARQAFVTPQTMQVMLVKLEKAGLIERTPDEVHGRIQRTLTSAGSAALKKAHDVGQSSAPKAHHLPQMIQTM